MADNVTEFDERVRHTLHLFRKTSRLLPGEGRRVQLRMRSPFFSRIGNAEARDAFLGDRAGIRRRWQRDFFGADDAGSTRPWASPGAHRQVDQADKCLPRARGIRTGRIAEEDAAKRLADKFKRQIRGFSKTPSDKLPGQRSSDGKATSSPETPGSQRRGLEVRAAFTGSRMTSMPRL